MKKLVLVISLFMFASTVFAAESLFGRKTSQNVEKTTLTNKNLLEARRLIEARLAGKICQASADQKTIIDLIKKGRAEDAAQLDVFVSSLNDDGILSDVFYNLNYKMAVLGTDIAQINDVQKWEDLLVGTRYFSQISVFGPPGDYILDLHHSKRAQVHYRKFENGQPVSGLLNGTWQAYVEVEPFGDYYHFVEVNLQGGKHMLLLVEPKKYGSLSLVVGSNPKKDEIFFAEPFECGI